MKEEQFVYRMLRAGHSREQMIICLNKYMLRHYQRQHCRDVAEIHDKAEKIVSDCLRLHFAVWLVARVKRLGYI